MGDCLRAGKPPQYFTKPSKPTQPPALSGTGNGYQPKCDEALRLGSKGRYGSFHLWINVWVAGFYLPPTRDPLLTRAIPERLRDEQLIIKRYTNKDSFLLPDT